MQGIDYSFNKPDLACTFAKGKRFVIRYLSNRDSPKNLIPQEVKDCRELGMSIVTVYQTTASFMISSRATGRAAATVAQEHRRYCGLPFGPVYFALDTDPARLSPNDWNAVKEFLVGCSDITGRHNVGVYGGYTAIMRLVPFHARYGWQTYAWSQGRKAIEVGHLYQYKNGVNLCGGTVDLNENWEIDFGQWPSRNQPTLPLPIEDEELMPYSWMMVTPGKPVILLHGDKVIELPVEQDMQELQRLGIPGPIQLSDIAYHDLRGGKEVKLV